ncbi:MAG: DUF4445 domain-containing protein [Spirochaetales bacterium]|nr:DUF4445 domain-containing protein [Spirochaetales bacterium]
MAKMYFPQYARGRGGVELRCGQTVLQHIRRIGGVEIDSDCGGRGDCGRDVIRLERGAASLGPATAAELHLLGRDKLERGQRLACQAEVADTGQDIHVFIPNFGKYTVLSEYARTEVELDPCVRRLGKRVMHDSGRELGPYRDGIYGLAIDIGTTTLVLQVVDLENGENVGTTMACKNPQIAYGNEVISRIGYTIDHPGGLSELQESVVEGINQSLAEWEKLLPAGDGMMERIYEVVLVGNSTMRDLAFGRDVSSLGLIPFEAGDTSAISCQAAEIGLHVHPKARVYGPPLIGGHAGSDCLADIIATGLYESDEVGMIIDIGTNGEVVIGNRHKLLTASCAAGGAYEGYQISCGVGAIEGAITRFEIENGRGCYATLGDKHPVGVCGSGVIDLLAEMLNHGIMDRRARIQKDYCFADGLCISQEDINQLIIAKAGLRTDQDLLIRYCGLQAAELDRIYLAGAFGNFLNVDNAMAIGLLPRIDKDRIIRFGNGALAGARVMLCSKARRGDAERLSRILTHLKPNEIEGAGFQYLVAENIYFE